jgi:ABC-2 type transport system permease protein
MPVRLSRVLMAKNLASLTFVFLEISAVASVCAMLRMPITLSKLIESFLVTLVITIYLLAVGNLGSTYWPRPVNPAQSWRSASAGRFQALLMMLYPIVSIPVVMAYLARYAFESDAAFFAVLALGAAIGCVFYWVAMDSAVKIATERKEQIVTALSAGEGPISA